MNCEEVKRKISIRMVWNQSIFSQSKKTEKRLFILRSTEEKIPSLSVDFVKNKAFDFGTGKSYDVISIVQQINQCSVSEALKYLET